MATNSTDISGKMAEVSGTLHFDGACRPNPGHGTCGFVLRIGNKTVTDSIPLGPATNNIAEYEGLLAGMKEAIRNEVTSLVVYGDSLLVIRGVRGTSPRISKKPWLAERQRKILTLKSKFQHIEFHWVGRENNKEADRLT